MTSLNKGQRIAQRYVLLSRLARSRHAQLWLAQDSEALSQVVIKVARDSDDATVARRLLANEYDVGKRFNHPSVVRYHDFHDTDELCFLTLEYLSEGSLEAFKQRPWRQILPSIAQLCDALSHVHAKGYVHRDVKAANALLASDGRVKLVDFGIASVIGEAGLHGGGSPYSASPEQRAGRAPAISDDVYALGTLLHELLSGRRTSDTHDGEADNLGDVPGVLRDRVAQMLSESAAERPVDLAALAREFEDLVDQDPNATLPPDEFQVDAQDPGDGPLLIEPTVIEQGAPRRATPAALAGARRGVPRVVGLLAIVLLMFGAAAAFYILPRLAPTDIQPQTGASAPRVSTSTGQPAVAAPAVEPWRLAQIARTRAKAEETLEHLLEKQFFLEDKQVEIWAAEEYDLAKYAAIAGDRSFREKDYDAALASYTDGNDRLTRLLERSENLISESLASGARHIESGNSEAASENFELVLKLEPGNAAARRGRARAAQLPEVIALVASAREHERLGEFQAALGDYRKASAMDGAWSAATDGVARMNGKLAGSRFSAAMSDGYKAIEAQRFDAARAAFERARRISPGAGAIGEALAQLELRERADAATSLRAAARALEDQEDFVAAREKYRAALSSDPDLSFALAGDRRMTQRIELDEQLAAFLAAPDRLSNDSVYESARRALQEAAAIPVPWNRLTQQISQLEQYMANSRITSVVRLVSDNQTDVLVYRVGRLGRFDETALELRPGTYTAVGSRAGFRDVRRQFRIEPSGDTPIVEVRCEERI